MASIISAGTTSGTALNMSGDTTGNLAFQTSAGTYTQTMPNATGTIALTSDVIGVGQTWQTVTRAVGTTYTNSTGKPIMVAYTASCSLGNSVQGLTINGTAVYSTGLSVNGFPIGVSLIVPNGAPYVTLTNSGTLTLITWVELR